MINNIPNMITFIRLLILYKIILLIPQFILFKNKIIVLFLIGIATDFFDGYIARKFRMVTKFGKFFDGFIDYIFISVLVISLFMYNLINYQTFIPFFIIFLRDSVRNFIKIKKYNKKNNLYNNSITSTYLGKLSRVLQMITLSIILIFILKYKLFVTILAYISMFLSVSSFIMYQNN